MATTGVINTKLLRWQVGSTPVTITCQKDASLSINNETRDITCKDSGQWKDNLYGQTSWEGSGSGLASFDGTFSVDELTDLVINQTVSPVVFTTGVTGDIKWSGSVIWTKLDINSNGTNENVEVSYSFMGTGALTKATIS